MKNPPWPIYALIGVLVGAIAALAGAGVAVPSILTYSLIALIAGGLGITVPSSVSSALDVVPRSAPATVVASPAAAPAPGPPARAPPGPPAPRAATGGGPRGSGPGSATSRTRSSWWLRWPPPS